MYFNLYVCIYKIAKLDKFVRFALGKSLIMHYKFLALGKERAKKSKKV